MLQDIIINYFDKILLSTSSLFLCRFILFLGLYLENLFQEASHASFFCTYFLFIIKEISEAGARSYQALDAFENIIINNDNKERISSFLPDVLPLLVPPISSSQNPSFFDLLQTFLTKFDSLLPPSLLPSLLPPLTNRIISELHLPPSLLLCSSLPSSISSFPPLPSSLPLPPPSSPPSLFLNKCWNILRCLGELPILASCLQDQLEEVAEIFSSLLEKGYDADFDEDLLLLIGSLIKLGKRVSRRGRKVAGGVERFVAKVNGCFGNSWDTAVAWAMWEEEGGAREKEREDGSEMEEGGGRERGGGEGMGGKAMEERVKEGRRDVVWSMMRAAKMALLTDESISNEANQGQALLLMQLMLQVLI